MPVGELSPAAVGRARGRAGRAAADVLAAAVLVAVGVAAYFAAAAGAQGSDQGVCGRTEEVRDALVEASGQSACADVSDDDLLEVFELDLSGDEISGVAVGDFAGLGALRTLDLSDNSLASLPAGLFDDLYSLRTLRLHDNDIAALPVDIFDQLFVLETLTLHGNDVTELPDGMFDDLSPFGGVHLDQDVAGLARLRAFVAKHSPTSVEEFIEALPDLHKERVVLIYESQGLGAEHVSSYHPRVVSWGATGEFVFAWLTNPDAPDKFKHSVEFLIPGETSWTAGIIDFSGDEPEFSQPAVCQSCHGSIKKPLFPALFWDSTEMYVGADAYERTDYFLYYRARLLAGHAASENPRISPLSLDLPEYNVSPYQRLLAASEGAVAYEFPAEEASRVLALRHSEVLLGRLKERSDYAQFAEDSLCAANPHKAMQEPFRAANEHTLAVIADSGELVGGDYAVPSYSEPMYLFRTGRLQATLTFLVLHDLWETNAAVRDVYRATSNTDGIDIVSDRVSLKGVTAEQLLVHPPGEATAEDELLQLYRLNFGSGGRAMLAAIDSHNPTEFQQGSTLTDFEASQINNMAPRVCAALRQAKTPGNVRAAVAHDKVTLSWDAPSDATSVTGYRVMRSTDADTAGTRLGDTTKAVLEYADTSVRADTAYYYTVEALRDPDRDYTSAPLEARTLTDPNAPVIATTAALSAAEGSTTVATLSATDANTPAADLVWSIPSGAAGGTDRAKFTLSTAGALAFTDAKDFEAPDDSDKNGTYEVTVKVSDGSLSDTADLQVTLANVNEAPTAEAGDDQTVEMGATVTLSGSGTDPDSGDTLGYAWSQTSGDTVTLTNAATATATLTAPTGLTAAAKLVFTLTATDAGGLTGTDTVTVTVEGPAPAEPDITTAASLTAAEGSAAVATLTATDADTPITDLEWSIPAGNDGGADAAKFTLSTAGALAFTEAKDFESPDDSDNDGTYEVTVKVSDGQLSDTADLRVTLANLNEAPVADAGDNQKVAMGATVALAGSGTDPDAGDTLGYAWTQASGQTVTLTGRNTAAAGFTAPTGLAADAVLVFTLTVTDAGGLTGTDTVTVTVVAQDPLTATAEKVPDRHSGSGQFSFELAFSEEVPLGYEAVRDDLFAATGGTVRSARRHTPRSNVRWIISVEPSSNNDIVLAMAAGRACRTVGAVCADDGRRLSNSLEVTVAGPNTPNIISAAALTAAEGTTAVATLTATDADTPVADLVWSIAGGADSEEFTLSAAGVLAFTKARDFEISDDDNVDNVYEVTVRASDGANSDTADIEVTVSNVNEAPVAEAGDDQNSVAMGATVTLSGSGADPDAGDTLGYAWTQTSGQTVTLANAATAAAGFTAPTGLTADAVMVFTLTVTDAGGLSDADTVAITVKGVPPKPPDITTAAALTAAEGSKTVATLSATDADTAASDLVWSIPSGAAGGADRAKFTLSAAGVLSFTAAKDFESPDDSDKDGVYEVTVKVSDGSLSDTADIEVTLANVNEAPVADAGDDQTVEMGATVALSGSGADPDADDTLGYAWTQTSGQTVTLTNAATATAAFTAPTGLTADAVLVFTLTVTDAAGLSDTDTVTVTVAGPPPAAPEITTAATLTAAEGTKTVATLTATDADTAAANLVWSIPTGAAGGADRAKFTLSAAGVLSFAAAKDFESPDDTGGDGTYEVTVKVSDGELSDTADLRVSLANVNEAPAGDAGENQTVEMGATVTLSGSGADPDSGDTLGYAWTQTSGQTVTLTNAATATAAFTAPTGLTADAVLVFTLTVTDAGGLTGADTVTVTVQGPPPEHEWGERLSDRDISLGDASSPTGLWSNGTDVWVITDADSGEISVYSLADGTEHTARGYTLTGRSGFLTALWSDGTTIWVSGFDGDILAYRLSDGARQTSSDLDSAALAAAGNTLPTGLWSDGTTMWVADYGAQRVFAYDLATKARATAKEFALNKRPGEGYGPFGIWSDGTTMWISVWAGRQVLAHDLDSGQRQPGKDIATTPSSTQYPNGIWSNGDITWVLDDQAKTIYAYATPG